MLEIKLFRAPITYIIISTILLFFYNTILIVGSYFDINYSTLIVISYLINVGAGYALHSLLTFKVNLKFSSFFLYSIAAMINIPVAIFSVYLFVEMIKMPMIIAAPTSSIILFLWNFFFSYITVTSRFKDWTRK